MTSNRSSSFGLARNATSTENLDSFRSAPKWASTTFFPMALISSSSARHVYSTGNQRWQNLDLFCLDFRTASRTWNTMSDGEGDEKLQPRKTVLGRPMSRTKKSCFDLSFISSTSALSRALMSAAPPWWD